MSHNFSPFHLPLNLRMAAIFFLGFLPPMLFLSIFLSPFLSTQVQYLLILSFWLWIPGVFFILSLLPCIFLSLRLTLSLISVAEGPEFSRFSDFFLPLLLLLSPWAFSLCVFFLWEVQAQVLLLLFFSLHFLLTFPSILHGHFLRKWGPRDPQKFTLGWDPYLWVEILFSLSYVYVFFLVILFLRYLRLGQNLDWSFFYDHSWDLFILSFPMLTLLPHFFSFLLLFRDLRRISSLYVENLSFSLHLFLLGYDIYFHLLFFLHKLYFSATQYFLYPHSLAKEDQSLFQRFRGLLFFHFPSFLSFFNLLFLSLEFIVRQGHIHYSLHLFFYSFLFLQFFLLWRKLGFSDFPHIVCLSDYAYRRWARVRFPSLFWHYFPEALGIYGFTWDFTSSEEEEILRVQRPWKLRSKVSFDSHISSIHSRVQRAYPARNSLHTSSLYYRVQGVRWMHSGVSQPLHNCTALYARNFLDFFSLLNSPQGWHSHFRTILYAEKYQARPYPSSLYISSSPSSSGEIKNPKFIAAQEVNFLDHFSALQAQGVSVQTFSPSLAKEASFLCQPHPDVFFNYGSSSFPFRGIIAYDGKASSSSKVGSHKIFHSMNAQEYGATLRSYEHYLLSHNLFNPSMSPILDSMRDFSSSGDFQGLYLIWAKNIHLFPSQFLPPLRVSSPISTSGFTDEFKRKFLESQIRNEQISSILFGRNIPQRKDFSKSFSSEDVFSESALQKILGE